MRELVHKVTAGRNIRVGSLLIQKRATELNNNLQSA